MNNPFDTQLFDRAATFALEAHSGTERRGKGIPYILHPMEAASIVATVTNDPEMLAAAILHDVVEDTEVSLEQLREEFGERVAQLVASETAPHVAGMTWRHKREIQVAQLAAAGRDNQVVALGDKLSNMRGIAHDYRQMGNDLWSRFHAPGGKSDIAWYYRSLAEAMIPLKGLAPYEEFLSLIKEVFF